MKKLMIALMGLTALSAFAAIPLPEHPRPDFERTDWINLNGSWDFRFDGEREFTQKILVPFGWGSPASGVKDGGDNAWYRREVTIPAEWKGKRVFVVVGAADHDTTAYFAGMELGRHSGGYTPFEFELTDFADWGKPQQLLFKIWDPNGGEAGSGGYLFGKQGYGNARGIWQTVYLEARGDTFIDSIHFAPHAAQGTVDATLRLASPAKAGLVCEFSLAGQRESIALAAGTMVAKKTFRLDKPHLWNLDDPYLYDVVATLRSGDIALDSVKTYFGLRDISTAKNPNGDWYVTLNGKPLYLQMCLDQSYHPEGWYTFPSDEFMKNEILLSKRLGLTGNRVHIKVEIPRKLYWADKLGVLIQADVPCAWGDASEAMFEEHWKCFEGMVRRDFNHPSIYQWTLFNETWGLMSNRTLEMGLATGRKGGRPTYRPWSQRKVAEAYLKAKAADSTRLVEDNSPCNGDHVATDVYTWHGYRPGYRWEETVVEFCKRAYPGSRGDFIGGHVQRGTEPMMNSECGNVWGYKGSTGDCDLTWDYHLMMNAFRRHLKCGGWLYTEHHDVCNEWNGYVRFDRTAKEFGIEEIFPGMTIRDFHADAAIPLDTQLCRTFAPGETYTLPVDISLTTDRYVGKDLSLSARLHWFDRTGAERWSDVPGLGGSLGSARTWQNGRLTELKIALPKETALGSINVCLMADKATIARNFTCFNVKSAQEPAAVRPVAAEWTGGSTNVLSGLKYNGFGKGYFEYEFATTDGGTFYAEVSTKRKNAKDFPGGMPKGGLDYMLGGGIHNRGKNPNSYPQTSVVDKFAGAVKVYANGTLVATVNLPDDPADHRGILSWASQLTDRHLREAGSYGYLVKAAIPKNLVKDGKVRIRLEGEKGLAIYGRDFGRYPFGPQLLH